MSTIDHRHTRRASSTRRSSGRIPRPDPLAALARLTGRDRALLELLAEHRVLATDHVAAWLFPTIDTAQRRLVTLYRLGVLNRFRIPQLDGAITSWRYTLGPLGAAVLAAMRGTTAPQPAVVHRRTLRLAAHPELAHLLGINNLLSQLAAHSRTQAHPPLALCWGERRATDACGALARPDALLLWGQPGRAQLVGCLEYDTGTERLAAVTDKLPGYSDLALAGGPRLPTTPADEDPATGCQPPPLWVLFLLPTLRREANLRQRLAGHHAATTHAQPTTGATALRVATSTSGHLEHLGGAADVWLPLHTTERVSLTRLATATRTGTR